MFARQAAVVKPLCRSFSSTMEQLTKRAVAGSFIFKFPEDGGQPKVALFKRSGKVRTYRHKYAPISGSVEATDSSPLATAYREIQEETTLTSSSLCLYCQGKPYTFTDASISRQWTINPFAFTLVPATQGGKGEAGITLDWEHEGYDWFDVASVTDDEAFNGVPKLLESLRRVWPAFDMGSVAATVLNEGLRKLKDDHESGARQLAAVAIGVFEDVVRKLDVSDKAIWWGNVRRAGWHLWKNGRESMGAPILSAILTVMDIVENKIAEGESLSKVTVEDIMSSVAKTIAQQREQSGSQVKDAFKSFIQQQQQNHHESNDRTLRILTLSSSSTITSCLTHLLAQTSDPIDLRILESRPLFEGAKLAHRLSSFAQTNSQQVAVSVYTDAAAAIAAKDVHLVLLGADLIDQAGNVSNKTGSLPAVLAAKHISPDVKVAVVSGKDKVLPFKAPGHEENDPTEVTTSWGMDTRKDGVKVRNVYFEWVDRDLIDAYITDEGVADGQDVMQWADEIRKRAERHFDGL